MANYGFRLFIEEQLFVYVRGNMVFQDSGQIFYPQYQE